MCQFGQLGHVGHLVDKDVVGTEVVMHQFGGVAVKVHRPDPRLPDGWSSPY